MSESNDSITFHKLTLTFDLLDILSLKEHLRTSEQLSSVVDGLAYDSGTKLLTLVCRNLAEEDIPAFLSSVNEKISTYVNTPIPNQTSIINTALSCTEVQDNTFRIVSRHIYQSMGRWVPIKWQVMSYITSRDTQSQSPSYMLRVVNIDNNTVLGEIMCSQTNLDNSIIDIMPPAGVICEDLCQSCDHDTFELQAKVIEGGCGNIVIKSSYIVSELIN